MQYLLAHSKYQANKESRQNKCKSSRGAKQIIHGSAHLFMTGLWSDRQCLTESAFLSRIASLDGHKWSLCRPRPPREETL